MGVGTNINTARAPTPRRPSGLTERRRYRLVRLPRTSCSPTAATGITPLAVGLQEEQGWHQDALRELV